MKNFEPISGPSPFLHQKRKNKYKKTVVVFFVVTVGIGWFFFSDGADSRMSDKEAQKQQREASVLGVADYFDDIQRVPINSVLPVSGYVPIRTVGYGDYVASTAHASVILDAESGTLLQYNNGKKQQQIASLTKLMTAIVALDNIEDISEPVTITEKGLYVIGTVVGCPNTGRCTATRMHVGEKIAFRDVLTATLINSANDAAISLAIHVGGTEKKFVEMMNQKARELGLSNTHFCTASGLEPDGREYECYSSAYDVARIAAYSLRYKEIWNILQLPPGTTIYSIDGRTSHQLLNTNKLLGQYPGLLGTKTGFTPNAGHSLLAVAQNEGGHRIVVALLDDPYRWKDVKDMMNWAFKSYQWE